MDSGCLIAMLNIRRDFSKSDVFIDFLVFNIMIIDLILRKKIESHSDRSDLGWPGERSGGIYLIYEDFSTSSRLAGTPLEMTILLTIKK